MQDYTQNENTYGKGKYYFIAIVAVVIVLTNLVTAITCYFVYKASLFPTPVDHNIVDVNYDPEQDVLAGIFDTYKNNVVEIRAQRSSGGSWLGSGIIIEYDNGYPLILTNFHVISDSTPHTAANAIDDDKISIKFFGSLGFSPTGLVDVLGYDTVNDIAVLRFNQKPIQYIDMLKKDSSGNFLYVGSQKEIASGQRVLAIGNAIGHGTAACDGIISLPEVSISLTGKVVMVMQITAPINSGNSGGPLFGLGGKLIGINTYQSRSSDINGSTEVDNISYTVPVDFALSIYRAIVQNPLNARPIYDRQVALYAIKAHQTALENTFLIDNVLGVEWQQDYLLKDDVEHQFVSVKSVLSAGESDILAEERVLQQGDILVQVGDYQLFDTQTQNGKISYISLMSELFKYGSNGQGENLVITFLRDNTVHTRTISRYKKI